MIERQFVDEAGRDDRLPAAIDHAIGGEGDDGALAGAGDPDIGKAAFLLERARATLVE